MDNAKERGNREALAIEDAETKILIASKKAVVSGMTFEQFTQAVRLIIAEAKKNAPSIADRIENPLKDYATRCIAKQRQIVNLWALAFASALIAKKDVTPLEKIVDKDILRSDYFTVRVNRYALASPAQMTMQDYMREVKNAYNDLIASNAQEKYASNVSLRNVAEMQVRYEHQMQMIDDISVNNRLVWIVPHANCSKRCERYQGRIYSTDGTSGTIDGKHFVPLEVATDDRENPERGKYGYINGCITGFNCRHQLKPYTKGTTISPLPAKEVRKQRAINERQRQYERKIRDYKKAAIAYGDSPKGKQSRRNAIEENKLYRAFCEKNGVTYYAERTKIFD